MITRAYFVTVLLAKKRHRPVFVDSDIDGHVVDDLDALIAQDLFVDNVLDVLQLFVFNRGEMRKVEAQMIGIDQRSCLLHMLAKHLAQTRVEQVRGRVIAHGGLPDGGVHDGVDFVAHANHWGAPLLALFEKWGFF